MLAIMTRKDYQAILETLEILSDDNAVEQLLRSIKEVKEKKQVPWKDTRPDSKPEFQSRSIIITIARTWGCLPFNTYNLLNNDNLFVFL